jgi:hypothetical protein
VPLASDAISRAMMTTARIINIPPIIIETIDGHLNFQVKSIGDIC